MDFLCRWFGHWFKGQKNGQYRVCRTCGRWQSRFIGGGEWFDV